MRYINLRFTYLLTYLLTSDCSTEQGSHICRSFHIPNAIFSGFPEQQKVNEKVCKCQGSGRRFVSNTTAHL